MESLQDTIAAIATPLGEGGLGVIRVSGSAAIAIVKAIFQPAKPIDLVSVPSHTCHFGTMLERHPSPLLGEGGRCIDHVIVTVFRAPHSYTGEDVVEISAHGSPFVLQQILQGCLRQGARLAAPGEFTLRAFLSGKLDLPQAEAVADLIHAKTEKAHGAAIAQLEGHLSRRVRQLRDRLLPLLAHVEVGLDHSDEDHAFLSRAPLVAECQEVQAEIAELLASARMGKLLREGLRVALVGRPNVGKSSLLNSLLKEERAIVTPIAGTTRDTLEESVDWEGLPVVLTDTAGVRETPQDPIERLGIERTQKALNEADVVLALFDGSEPLTEEDEWVVQVCSSRPHVWVVNKSDLPARWEFNGLRGIATSALLPLKKGGGEGFAPRIGGAIMEKSPSIPLFQRGRPKMEEQNSSRSPFVWVSAKTGDGLPALVQAVKRLAFKESASSGEARWMLNVRHRAALERAGEALVQALQAAQKDAYEECVALELKTTLQALGEIIGETTTEDLLEQIFSTFCIGK